MWTNAQFSYQFHIGMSLVIEAGHQGPGAFAGRLQDDGQVQFGAVAGCGHGQETARGDATNQQRPARQTTATLTRHLHLADARTHRTAGEVAAIDVAVRQEGDTEDGTAGRCLPLHADDAIILVL